MSKNPYQVLGVPDGASEAECTRAYKRLAKKYHPDLNPNNAVAAKMMTEINAAYDEVKKEAATNPGQRSYRQYSQERQSDGDRAHLNAAAQFINNRQFAQALNVLSHIDNRTAEWYYLAAVANERAGRDRIAYNHIKEACAMEPSNIIYKEIEERLIKRGADQRPSAGSVYYGDYSVQNPQQKKRKRR